MQKRAGQLHKLTSQPCTVAWMLTENAKRLGQTPKALLFTVKSVAGVAPVPQSLNSTGQKRAAGRAFMLSGVHRKRGALRLENLLLSQQAASKYAWSVTRKRAHHSRGPSSAFFTFQNCQLQKKKKNPDKQHNGPFTE